MEACNYGSSQFKEYWILHPWGIFWGLVVPSVWNYQRYIHLDCKILQAAKWLAFQYLLRLWTPKFLLSIKLHFTDLLSSLDSLWVFPVLLLTNSKRITDEAVSNEQFDTLNNVGLFTDLCHVLIRLWGRAGMILEVYAIERELGPQALLPSFLPH